MNINNICCIYNKEFRNTAGYLDRPYLTLSISAPYHNNIYVCLDCFKNDASEIYIDKLCKVPDLWPDDMFQVKG